MIDVKKTIETLAELAAIDEKIADRGPILLLPRPQADIPNPPRLRARQEALFATLRVKRAYSTPKGQDLDNNGKPIGYDLNAIGTVEAAKVVTAGAHRAAPGATTIIQVGFPTGDHLWFEPSDLVPVAAAAGGA